MKARALMVFLAVCPPASAVEFDRIVIDNDFPGGYQVEVADVNGDGRPDIVGVGGGTCAWYENPTWKKRIVSTPKQTPGIISSATKDLDGDGKAEIAIAYDFAMNEPTQGELTLATPGANWDAPWSFTPIAHVGSIHRLRWGDVDGDKRPDLVVAPIFGPGARAPAFDQERAALTVYHTGSDPRSGRWVASRVSEGAPVLHAIDVLDLDDDGKSDILSAGNNGVTHFRHSTAGNGFVGRILVPGAPGSAPRKGCSEVHVGRLAGGRRFLATIDPWHGNEVAICLTQGTLLDRTDSYGPRTVIDTTLADGHALWVADVDGDGDGEVFAGHRGKDHRVSMYDFDGKAWVRTVLDNDIAAQDLRGGDLDGDRVPDVVAIGGSTHNVIWYRFRAEKRSSKTTTP